MKCLRAPITSLHGHMVIHMLCPFNITFVLYRALLPSFPRWHIEYIHT